MSMTMMLMIGIDHNLGDEDIDEEEGEQHWAKKSPAGQPIRAQLSAQHEVDVPDGEDDKDDDTDDHDEKDEEDDDDRMMIPCNGPRAINPVHCHDLNGSKGQDKQSASIEVHHLQYHLSRNMMMIS